MYKCFITSQSNHIERLWLAVLSVSSTGKVMSSTGKVMSLFGKGFETDIRVFPPCGHLAFHPQAGRFLPSLYFLPSYHSVEYSSGNTHISSSIDCVVCVSD